MRYIRATLFGTRKHARTTGPTLRVNVSHTSEMKLDYNAHLRLECLKFARSNKWAFMGTNLHKYCNSRVEDSNMLHSVQSVLFFITCPQRGLRLMKILHFFHFPYPIGMLATLHKAVSLASRTVGICFNKCIHDQFCGDQCFCFRNWMTIFWYFDPVKVTFYNVFFCLFWGRAHDVSARTNTLVVS